MADLPQAMRLHRLHQRLEHVLTLARRVLKVRQPVPGVHHRRLLVGIGHVAVRGLALWRQRVA